MERVAIVGIGQTKHVPSREELNYPELVYEAVSLALEDAAIGVGEIDNVITTSNDFWDGRTISSMATGDVSGGHGKNISCVEGDGTFGAFYGLTRILSGAYGTTLVTAYSKGSESVSSLVTNAVFDPIYTRCIGLDMVTACALQARRYMKRYGISEEQCALVSVKNHGNAMHNPNAHLGMKLSVEEVMESRIIAAPLKLYDISPISDGACAIDITDLTSLASMCEASRELWRKLGIREPLKEVDVIELYQPYSWAGLIWIEDMGLCKKGEGPKLVWDGVTDMGGELPMNPSGGVVATNPIGATGLIRCAEVALQIQGKAGARQVPDARLGVSTGFGGCYWTDMIALGKNKPE